MELDKVDVIVKEEPIFKKGKIVSKPLRVALVPLRSNLRKKADFQPQELKYTFEDEVIIHLFMCLYVD